MYVRYVGKKLPCKYSNPQINFVANFSNNEDIVEIAEGDYDWIMKFNPTGFIEKVIEKRLTPTAVAKLPGREEMDAAVKTVLKKKEPPAYVCEKCGKEYQHSWHKRHYEKHMAEHQIDKTEVE